MHKRQVWKVLLTAFGASLLSGCITVNLLPAPAPLEEKRVSGTGPEKVLLWICPV